MSAAIPPPTAEPSEKPMNITMIMVARLRCGAYSHVSAIGLGMAPPSPRPVTKRQTRRLVVDSAVTVSSEVTPNHSVQKMMTGLRPIRSASGLNASAPSMSPNRPAANTGPSSPGFRLQALLSVGAT